MHALIIEDQVLIAALIEDGLRDLGYSSFDVAAREDLAVAAAEARCPDLITADDRLIDGTGVDAVLTICARQAIPVVFIAADVDNIIAAIPEAVLIPKPFRVADLKEAVGMAIVTVAKLRSGRPQWPSSGQSSLENA
jgi:DNA-binding response OmpR family regulator